MVSGPVFNQPAEKPFCPQCRQPLAATARGLCLRCLVSAALDEGSKEEEGRSDSPGGAGEGRTIAGYKLLERIGEGGMGVVCRARQNGLGRIVALKMIRGGELAREADVRRFQVEAEAAARLQHPNIVTVHEAGDHEGQHFLVTEYVEGGSLADLLRKGPLPPRDAAALVRTIAEAIHYAHGRGVLHRDLKPSNILIDARGQPRVTDFGAAKMLGGGPELTQSGTVLGSPGYMPPEQASASRGKTGARSDVYSLGAILYALLSGEPPFQGGTSLDTMRQVLEREPEPLSHIDPDIPRDLEVICLKCLRKAPEQRYGSALMLAEELGRFLNHEPILARPMSLAERLAQWGRRRPALAGLAGVLALVLAAGTPLMLSQWNRARLSEQFTRQNLYAADIHLAQLAVREGRFERARAELAPYADEARGRDLRGWEWHYLWRQAQGDSIHVLAGHASGVSAVAFSPDGRFLASGAEDGTAKLWDFRSRKEMASWKAHSAGVTSLSFSPDSRQLATTGGDNQFRLWHAEDGPRLSAHTTLHLPHAVFSPDGAVMAAGLGGSPGRVDLRLGAVRRSIPSPGGIFAFSRDAALLFAGAAEGGGRIWDLGDASRAGTEVTPLETVTAASFSFDGRRLATALRPREILLWQTDSGRFMRRFAGHGREITALAFFPRTNLLVSASEDRTLRIWDAAAPRSISVLSGHAGGVRSVAVSPDGNWIASGSHDRTVRLWPVYSLADDPAIRDPAPAENRGRPVFSKDGQHLALIRKSDNESRSQVGVFASESGELQESLPSEGIPLSFSPDGYLLRVAADEQGAGPRLEAWRLSDGQKTDSVVLEGRADFRAWAWSPDETVFCASAREGTGESAGPVLWHAATGRRLAALQPSRRELHAVVYSPDGRFLAASGGEHLVTVWRTADRRKVAELRGHQDRVECLRFSPDGRLLASAGWDRTVRLWETRGWKPVGILAGHQDWVAEISFSHDGKTLASAGWDNRAKLWHVAAGRELLAFSFAGEVEWAGFSPDGETFAISETDGGSARKVHLLKSISSLRE